MNSSKKIIHSFKSKKYIFPFFALNFYCFVCFSFATDIKNLGPSFNHIKTINNVEIGEVNTITQDKMGFIWFGTNNGLHRYDGYELKTYKHQENNENSLSNNSVIKILSDDNYNLWLATYGGGLNKLNLNNEKFTHFKTIPDAEHSLKTNRLWNLHPDTNDQILISSHRGLDIFDKQKQVNHRVSHKDDIPLDVAQAGIWVTFKDSKNHLWLGTLGNGVYIYDEKNESVKQIQQKNDHSGLIHNFVRTITEDVNGNIWIGTDGGISVFNNKSNTYKHYSHIENDTSSVSGNDINKIFLDSANRIWIGTYGQGLNLYNPDSDTFTRFNESNLSANIINDIFQDTNSVLWFATEQGIFQLTPSAETFSRYSVKQDKNVAISAIFASNDEHLWLGTNLGVYKKALNEDKFTLVLPQITDSSSITEDKKHNIWIASHSSGLHKVSKDDELIRSFSRETGDLQSNSISTVVFDEQNNIWVGLIKQQANKGGFILLDETAGTLSNFFEKENVVDILEISKIHILIATNDFGVAIYNKKSKELFKINKAGNSNIDANRLQVTSLFKDSHSRIWITTDGNGLWQYNPQLKNLIHHPKVKIEHIRGMSESMNSMLWLTSAGKLTSYQPETQKTQKTQNFKVSHGLANTSFTKNTIISDKNSDIYLGTNDGLISFSPTEVNTNSIVPRTIVTDVKVLNKPVSISTKKNSILSRSIEVTNKIILNHQDYLFSFKFSSLNFIDPNNSLFKYKMVGLDKEWLSTNSTNRVATYTTLPHGDYIFKVRSSSADGVWDTEGTSVQVKIRPPFWLTKQAYVVYFISVLIFLYLFTQFRIKTIKNKAKKLEIAIHQRTIELEDSKSELELKNKKIYELLIQKQKIFSNISHEFRTPLTLILSPIDRLLEAEKSKQKQISFQNIKRNAYRLLKMVDQLLDLAQLEEKHEVERRHYNLRYTMQSIIESFNSLAKNKDIQIQTNDLSGTQIELQLIPDSLEKILMNLLSNAIKYSKPKGIVKVSAHIEGKFVVISVSDKGYGIDSKEQSSIFERFYRSERVINQNIPGVGIGLSLVKELVNKNNGRITVESTINHGSSFNVSLPITLNESLKTSSLEKYQNQRSNIYSFIQLESEILQNKEAKEQDQAFESSTTKSLLIIEDNVEMCHLIVESFKDEFTCITARNGAEGLKQANLNIPDFIICDVMMPCINGYEVAKELRNNENTSHIPIVMLTAKGDLESRMLGWQQNVDDYIMKPFIEKELKERVNNILSIRGILRKKFGDSLNTSNLIETINDFNINERDKCFLEKFEKVIEKNYTLSDFNRTQASSYLALSERQLNRKLAALVDHNFSEYLRKYRLRKSIELITTGLQVAEIGEKIGFSSTAYFGACFKAEYGKTVKQFERALIQNISK